MGYKNNQFTIYIKNKGTLYKPLIEETIEITWQRGFQAGEMKFKVIKDDVIDFQEGNPVILMNHDEIVFVGYVWKKHRSSKQLIETTCYDQLRYLKNKDSIQYENKTYSELLAMICNDGFLKLGAVDDTKYKIPARTERDKEYFQMLKTADELTLSHTGKNYELYDEKGKICLREWKNIPTTKNVINYDVTQDFDYTTDIDSAYDRIKVNYVDDETKATETFISEDPKHLKEWGRLQYYVETSTKMQLKERAETLLKLLNRKHRVLTIKNTIGDFNVRGGSLVPVYFPFLGDIHVNSLMLVNKVTHHIKGEHHFMDLEIYNKDIMPTMTGGGLFEGAQQKQKAESGDPMMGGGAAPGSVEAALQWGTNRIGWRYSQPRRLSEGSADCSSLVMRSFQSVGLLPNSRGYNLTSRTISKDPHFVQIPISQARRGDVLWHSGHVAFYMGDNKTLEARWSTQRVGYSVKGNRFTKCYRIKGG